MRVVDVKRIDPTGGKVFRRAEVSTFQKATRQDAEPQLDLMEPRPLFRRTMAHMFMRWVTQECPPLLPALQSLGDEGESAPRSHEVTHVQAPGCMEVVDHPVIAGHGGQLLQNVGQMRRD